MFNREFLVVIRATNDVEERGSWAQPGTESERCVPVTAVVSAGRSAGHQTVEIGCFDPGLGLHQPPESDAGWLICTRRCCRQWPPLPSCQSNHPLYSASCQMVEFSFELEMADEDTSVRRTGSHAIGRLPVLFGTSIGFIRPLDGCVIIPIEIIVQTSCGLVQTSLLRKEILPPGRCYFINFF